MPRPEGRQLSKAMKLGIVAALEREIRPLVAKKNWRKQVREYSNRQFTFFESAKAVIVCGGVGGESARRATEALINLYPVEVIVSAGFAGALDSKLRVGDIIRPGKVVNLGDGSTTVIPGGTGTLLSSASVAGTSQKAKLGESYGAQAVEMEAASVARGAEARSIGFIAIKAISDELGFDMPDLGRFIGREGEFRTGAFLLHMAVRPWMWSKIVQLARHSSTASAALCNELEQLIADQSSAEFSPAKVLATGPAAMRR
jgi:adenosylhomocysteine nucleosidase